MRRRILKSPRARIVALALGSAALGSLATAPASFAVAGPKPPAVGTNCQLDGKISGRGSTFQTKGLNSGLITGYTNDICGPVGAASNLNAQYTNGDPAGSSMIAYNYTSQTTAVANGSGAGLHSQDCRSDAFGGTDLPYSGSQLAGLDSAPGTESGGTANCPGTGVLSGTTTNINPPYPPGPTFPATGEANANLMNFPIAGGAVAIAVNLNGMCTTAPPAGTVVNMTSAEFDGIMQGKINQWNDPTLIATDPFLGPTADNCTGSIQRIVRTDNSGTTAITKTDLNGIDSGTLCDGTTAPSGSYGAWASLGSANPNTAWPSTPGQPTQCGDGTNVAAPAYSAGGTLNGSGNLITLEDSTSQPSGFAARPVANCPGATTTCGGEGGIGYAELGLWPSPLPAGVFFVNMQNAAGTSFVSPGTAGAASKCNPGANGLPGGGTANEAVGLGGVNDNWANDAGAALTPQAPADQRENITFAGSGYPLCGLTFDMVYAGINNETGETAPVTGASTTVAGPVIGMTNDSLRTLYSYFGYVFSPAGQANLDKQTYDELPAAWLSALRAGFQNNY